MMLEWKGCFRPNPVPVPWFQLDKILAPGGLDKYYKTIKKEFCAARSEITRKMWHCAPVNG
jgi:hypothetical protein